MKIIDFLSHVFVMPIFHIFTKHMLSFVLLLFGKLLQYI